MNNGVPWSSPRMNPSHLNLDNAAFIEAVQFYADLTNKHKVAPTASELQSTATPELFSRARRRWHWAGTGATRRSTAPTAWISM
ncbi:putative bacterial extracellular solute-binding protein [Mycobacterium kansasii]|uniref:Putative bacterial extracellular solute-binding protein n=1 Tax=Mycobacterium kansasii TaxID=1768 RepID=A0A1V3WC13_MYCKA|nr:putative bacterial extracellular solute-binding protein [Mycobacterium kansasii]